MALLVEVLGVMFGGVAVASVLRGGRSRLADTAAGVALVVVVGASLLFFGNVWGQFDSFRSATRADEAASKQFTEDAGAYGGNGILAVNVGFLAWARPRILAGPQPPTFWITPHSAITNELVYQWSTYQLLPALHVDLTGDASWIVFYGVDPSFVHYDRKAFARLLVYAPGYALAARTNDG